MKLIICLLLAYTNLQFVHGKSEGKNIIEIKQNYDSMVNNTVTSTQHVGGNFSNIVWGAICTIQYVSEWGYKLAAEGPVLPDGIQRQTYFASVSNTGSETQWELEPTDVGTFKLRNLKYDEYFAAFVPWDPSRAPMTHPVTIRKINDCDCNNVWRIGESNEYGSVPLIHNSTNSIIRMARNNNERVQLWYEPDKPNESFVYINCSG